jgi:hypothetical protein
LLNAADAFIRPVGVGGVDESGRPYRRASASMRICYLRVVE